MKRAPLRLMRGSSAASSVGEVVAAVTLLAYACIFLVPLFRRRCGPAGLLAGRRPSEDRLAPADPDSNFIDFFPYFC